VYCISTLHVKVGTLLLIYYVFDTYAQISGVIKKRVQSYYLNLILLRMKLTHITCQYKISIINNIGFVIYLKFIMALYMLEIM